MRPLFMQGHARPLTWVLFNRDGDLLFTCGKDARLAVWSSDNGQRIGTYDTGKGVIWNCDITHDSERLICASADQKILIFNAITAERLHEIPEAGPVKFVEWNRKPGNQNRFVLCHEQFGSTSSRAIKCYSTEEGDKPRRLWVQDDYEARCIQVRWGPFDETIISCHENGDIMTWNAETGEYINEFKGHNKFITCINFSEDRLLMLTSCSDGNAKLWDTNTFKCLKTYATDRPLNSCDISPRFNKQGDQKKYHILLGGGQAAEQVTTTTQSEGKFQALLYHLIHGEELGSIKGHFGPINTLAWMPDGNGYASGGEDGYVRIYHFDDDYFSEKFD